jgi:hypothetical protein
MGQSPRSLDAPGKIIVVDEEAKLVRTLSAPSPSMRNFAFCPEEKVLYVMALDQIDAAPWHAKVYEVPNPVILLRRPGSAMPALRSAGSERSRWVGQFEPFELVEHRSPLVSRPSSRHRPSS